CPLSYYPHVRDSYTRHASKCTLRNKTYTNLYRVRDIYEMIGDPPTAKSALKGILCIAKRRSETPEGFPFLNKYRIECVTQNGEILCEEREKDILLLCAQLKNLFDSLEKHWDDKVLRYVDMLLVLFREHQRRQRHAGSVFPYWSFYKYGNDDKLVF